ncbi:MAG: glycosyltransferase family 4 protein [Candidatus Chisholmbacteria bacterium]|nr:glycosyltransferase family 4 protein [Candidatus Chisholmbacteria bacterium]
MHIVILSFFSGLVERGVEVHVDELSHRLSSNHQVEVITASELPSPIKPYTNTESKILRRLYFDQISLAIKRATKTVLAKLTIDPPDLLYPVNNGWQSILSQRFCRLYKTKLILAGHSGPGWDDRVNLWLKPDVFIAFSPSQSEWAKTHSRGVNVVTIPHSVDTTKFNPHITPKKLNLPKPIFVTVSALSPKSGGGLPAKAFGWRNGQIAAWDVRRPLRHAANATAGETVKNIEATIKAVASLKSGSLLLIGKGEAENRIDKLGKQLLGPKRYQRFYVSHHDINQYYTASTVFTLASSASEAFGLVYLEALACNLPVVTVDDPLRRFIIGHAGVFIKDPDDRADYSGGLTQALQTNWGHKPRLQAQKFSWENTIGQYETLLKNLS